MLYLSYWLASYMATVAHGTLPRRLAESCRFALEKEGEVSGH